MYSFLSPVSVTCTLLSPYPTYLGSVFTLTLPKSTSAVPITASTVALVPTGSLTATAALIPGLASTHQFPTRAVIAASVSLAVFLTVLVVTAAFIAWYRMKLKFRNLEIVQREHYVRTTVEPPTAADNLANSLELHNLAGDTTNNRVRRTSRSEHSDASADGDNSADTGDRDAPRTGRANS
jgi:hypothetical protein